MASIMHYALSSSSSSSSSSSRRASQPRCDAKSCHFVDFVLSEMPCLAACVSSRC